MKNAYSIFALLALVAAEVNGMDRSGQKVEIVGKEMFTIFYNAYHQECDALPATPQPIKRLSKKQLEGVYKDAAAQLDCQTVGNAECKDLMIHFAVQCAHSEKIALSGLQSASATELVMLELGVQEGMGNLLFAAGRLYSLFKQSYVETAQAQNKELYGASIKLHAFEKFMECNRESLQAILILDPQVLDLQIRLAGQELAAQQKK